MEVERILEYKHLSEKDMLGMILSNRIDMGCSEGGMISTKAFDKVIEDLIKWKNKQKNTVLHFRRIPQICQKCEVPWFVCKSNPCIQAKREMKKRKK